MEYIVTLMVRAHVAIVLVTLVSYIVEKLTGLILIVTLFREEKRDYDEGVANADLFTGLYFVFLLGYLLYDVYIAGNAPDSYSFWKWLVVAIPLTVLFRILYHRYQGREPRESREE